MEFFSLILTYFIYTFYIVSDLGSAGGVNAIQLLRYIENILQQCHEIRPIEYYFEDLPTSDFSTLVKTIHDSNISDQFFPRCIGKSFYEKLFPSNSIHLCLSYITLHWLRRAPSKTTIYNFLSIYFIINNNMYINYFSTYLVA